MAKKKSSPNKSKAIREYIAAHPEAKPQAIVAVMKKKGVDVNAQFVSTVKTNAKKKAAEEAAAGGSAPAAAASKKAAKPVKRAGRKPIATTGTVTFDSLIKAKQLIEEMGGVEGAMNAISAYEQLVDDSAS